MGRKTTRTDGDSKIPAQRQSQSRRTAHDLRQGAECGSSTNGDVIDRETLGVLLGKATDILGNLVQPEWRQRIERADFGDRPAQSRKIRLS